MHQRVHVVVEALDAYHAVDVAQDMFNANYVGGGAPFDYCQPAHERFIDYSEDDLAFRLDTFEGVGELLKAWGSTLRYTEETKGSSMLDCFLHDQLWGQVATKEDFDIVVETIIEDMDTFEENNDENSLWVVPLDTHF